MDENRIREHEARILDTVKRISETEKRIHIDNKEREDRIEVRQK
jgi:hypothetical protein